MTDVPDVSEIGLTREDRERLVASVMRRIETRASTVTASVLGTVGSWARPVGVLASAALVAGIVALSAARHPAAPSYEGVPVAESFELWVQTGERPSSAEVMAVLLAGEGHGPRD